MNYPRIHTAQVLNDTTLLIEFTNQEQKIYDIRPLLNRPMFASVRSPAVFKNVQIEPGGDAIAWSTDMNLSEYEL